MNDAAVATADIDQDIPYLERAAILLLSIGCLLYTSDAADES